ncbi:aminoglycoside adenylyltransferase domain-containing protein [Paenibacillus thermotolerans]|uniref:aminoglycoside adenylyltransferase domain-containing protein n=1 Tax=Paenibacillus thermotolerans TaxID=3027807 RepID=UPI0023684FBB|nr:MULTISPECIES: aminoglycoside adenylyltransferase domain-containing protein [unclassified Paenibacillus]
MKPTADPAINRLLSSLLTQIQEVLGEKLTGLYVYGSLVWGDFDRDISDIDMLAALSSDLTEEELERLRSMHSEFANRHQEWNDRIEVQYYSTSALRTFKTKSSPMAVISPGEPLHFVEAGRQWLTNWYFVQDYGITLFGPSPHTFIEPISKAEFMEAVKEHAFEWREYVRNTLQSRPYQGYAILTMCRALYTLTNGEQVSKIKAARWAQKELPVYSQLIENALRWRSDYRNQTIPHEETYPETEEFVLYVSGRIEKTF